MSNILERLAQHANETPLKVAVTFLGDDNNIVDTLTYGDLWFNAVNNSGRFAQMADPGARVLLSYTTSAEFAIAFFACLHAGLVPVPTPSVRGSRYRGSVASIVDDCAASLMLCQDPSDEGARSLSQLIGREPEYIIRSLLTCAGPVVSPPRSSYNGLAYLQYTSGSTSAPKGVVVSHDNLAANLEMMSAAFDADAFDDVVGWAPLYHDMGLVANLLHPIWRGASSVLMSPGSFAVKPWLWLQAIDSFGATISGGPNYAYELCVARAKHASKLSIDLSRWRIAFNSAEPVRASTIREFSSVYAPNGFRREAMYPCYGMAEATLLISGGDPASAPKVEALSRRALAGGEASHPVDPEDRLELVGCGHPLQLETILIVDPVSYRRKIDRQVGEIWVSGPNVPAKYWGCDTKSRETYGAECLDAPGCYFLRTGDLGFFDSGELYFAGRKKDTIVLRGRNLYPQDVEYVAERCYRGLKINGAALFAVESPESTQPELVLVQEVEREFRKEINVDNCITAIRRAIFAEFGVTVSEVLLVRPGQIAKTSSGKIRRSATRDAYQSGLLRVVNYRDAQPTYSGSELLL